MFIDDIKNFAKQLEYEPTIENEVGIKRAAKIIVAGMGGSNLASGLIRAAKPELDIIQHRDYGLPSLPAHHWPYCLVIVNSFSGNTEEAISAYEEARKRKLSVAVVATGGKLIDMAKADGAPYIQHPAADQPRLSLGYNIKALLKIIGDDEAINDLFQLAPALKPEIYEERGRTLAQKLTNQIPLIYSSRVNLPLAYVWKTKLNETAKIPAFCNVFPELNHNEMTGFDRSSSGRALSDNFHFIFLKDQADFEKVHKRMDLTKKLLEDKGLSVELVNLEASSVWYKIFSSLIFADWTTYYLAQAYGVDPVAIPMVEEFKKLME